MKYLPLLLIFTMSHFQVKAQDIDLMMQAWYWDYFPGSNFGNWVNNLNGQTIALKNAGFKHIWLPPLPRTSTPNNQSNGYNPKDLYDLGESAGGGDCAWGSRSELNALIQNYNANGMVAVSDVVYNHRDGGRPERNDAVRTFIRSNPSGTPYPSDRFFCVLPIGSANPGAYGPGNYYLKIRSRSQGYNTMSYKLYAKTNSTTYNPTPLTESEPNGGGDCAQPNNTLPLGQDMTAQLGDWSGCHIDEFKITLTAGNFNTTDDTLFIYMTNVNSNGGYSDHYVYGLWNEAQSQDISNAVQYWTYTDFTNFAGGGGLGGMNYNSFRPNDNTAMTESLSGDENWPLFFYDYDQSQTSTQTVLNEWTKWQIQNVGLKGLRMDAVKHFSPGFVSQLLNYLHTQGTIPQMVVGEFFDGNASLLNNWVEDVFDGMSAGAKAAIKPRIFDFTLRNSLKSACDQFGYDVRNVYTGSMRDQVGADPFKIVTFVNNHDFRGPGEPIQNQAYLAYAYILTNNQVGAPCVFYPDYYGTSIPNAPVNNFKTRIDQLVQLHRTYIAGSPEIAYLNKVGEPYLESFNQGLETTTLVYQIKPNGSGKNVLVAFNFSGSPMDMYQEVNYNWGINTGDLFTDMLGYNSTNFLTVTNWLGDPLNKVVRIQIPARSYSVFVQGNNTSLPVQLVDFAATPEGADVVLRWNAATEQNFDRYEIERAIGRADRFETIGSVPQSDLNQYSLTDKDVPVNTSLYYRLKMHDKDGSFTYSPLREARIDKRSFEGYVTPNPSATRAALQLYNQREQVFNIQIFNTLGQMVHQQQQLIDEGKTSFELPDLASGTYTIQVLGENERMSLRWVVE